MRAALDAALDRFIVAQEPSGWEVKAESEDELEVDVWGQDRDPAAAYLGRWRVPAEGEPERLDHYLVPEDTAGTVFDPYSPTFGPLMAAIQAGEFEEASRRLVALRYPGRRVVAAYFDVSGFDSPEEVDALVGHVTVQAEAGDGYPDAEGVDVEVVDDAS